MSPHTKEQRWKRAQELYHAARELRITDWERFLEYHCENDPETRAFVERLLKPTDASSFLSDTCEDSP